MEVIVQAYFRFLLFVFVFPFSFFSFRYYSPCLASLHIRFLASRSALFLTSLCFTSFSLLRFFLWILSLFFYPLLSPFLVSLVYCWALVFLSLLIFLSFSIFLFLFLLSVTTLSLLLPGPLSFPSFLISCFFFCSPFFPSVSFSLSLPRLIVSFLFLARSYSFSLARSLSCFHSVSFSLRVVGEGGRGSVWVLSFASSLCYHLVGLSFLPSFVRLPLDCASLLGTPFCACLLLFSLGSSSLWLSKPLMRVSLFLTLPIPLRFSLLGLPPMVAFSPSSASLWG